jgi:CsoR family transcriptional regulator, copper-sensing transcriptional repressor
MDGDSASASAMSNRELRDRLHRIEGQVRGIAKMLDENKPCADVVTQVFAARSALDRVAEAIITSHVDECLTTLSHERARAEISRAVRMLAKV